MDYVITRLGILLFLFLWSTICFGQNLETIGKEQPLKVTGGLSVNQLLYNANRMQSGRMPYTYCLNGNLNFSLYGWSVPVSYTYSNQQGSFQQPFNQYGLHPTYKWITAHIGYASMTFSPYTLSGHQFLGVGLELSPGSIFKMSAMYGRLQKAVAYDTLSANIQPAYQRIGYGLKAGVNLGKASIESMIFRSGDELSSLRIAPDSLEVFPEENIALGLSGNSTILSNVVLHAEFGSSYLSRDIRSTLLSENFLYKKRTSSEHYNAAKASIKFSQPNYSLGATYERVDPGYRTHGAYYFNNDLENVTGNLTLSLLKKKVNLGANIGVQRDDLNHQKMSSMLRVVESYNLGFVPVNRLNVSATYSNFKSHTNVKSQFQTINQLTTYENLDTLNYTQISENTSLNVNYMFKGSERFRQSISLNSSFQKASEYQAQVLTNSGATFTSVNMAHSFTWVKSNTSLSSSLNFSNSKTSVLTTNTLGPTLSLRRSFLKNKLRASFSTSYNNSYSNHSLLNTILSFRSNAGYAWQKKHNFSLSAAVINRTGRINGGRTTYSEYTASFSYAYNF